MASQVGLIVVRDGFPERKLSLASGTLRLGRAEDNEICLPDIGVSRRHARILIQDDQVTFEDLGSGNGTWYAGQRVGTRELSHGDELVIEPFTLRFEIVREQDDTLSGTGEHTMKLGGLDALAQDPNAASGRLDHLDRSGRATDSWEITGSGLTIGRSDQRDIVIPDPAASRLHAELVVVGGVHWLKDTGAANGLFVNGRRIKERALDDGDVIRIGATEFRFALLEGLARSTDVLDEPQVERTENFAPIGAAASSAATAAWQPGMDAPPPPPPRQGFGGAAAPAYTPPPVHAAPPPPAATQAPPPPPPAGGFAAPQAGAFGAQATPAYSPPPPTGTGFGAPQGGGFVPPALGDAPQDGGFGAVEMAFDDAPPARKGKNPKLKTKKGGGFFSKPINLASVGILGVTLLMVGGKVVANTISSASSSPRTVSSTPRVGPTGEQLATADIAEVAQLMDEGMQLFGKGEYPKATHKFLKVLKIDPGNEHAERWGYAACEFITISKIRDATAAAASSDEERAEAKSKALDAASKALKGRSSLAAARSEVETALKINPDDEELSDALTQIRRKQSQAAQAVSVKKAEELEDNAKALYNRALLDLQRKNYSKAITGFEKVMAADPERQTKYYYSAEEGLSKARSEVRGLAQEPYAKALSSMKSGDYRTARTRLNEVLRIDPYHSAAKSKLAEVQKRLEAMASEKMTEAKVYEQANQTERALASYNEVKVLIADPKNATYRRAQDRIDALMR